MAGKSFNFLTFLVYKNLMIIFPNFINIVYSWIPNIMSASDQSSAAWLSLLRGRYNLLQVKHSSGTILNVNAQTRSSTSGLFHHRSVGGLSSSYLITNTTETACGTPKFQPHGGLSSRTAMHRRPRPNIWVTTSLTKDPPVLWSH
jgi:hypothetical protein